jgi:hypothetical protein
MDEIQSEKIKIASDGTISGTCLFKNEEKIKLIQNFELIVHPGNQICSINYTRIKNIETLETEVMAISISTEFLDVEIDNSKWSFFIKEGKISFGFCGNSIPWTQSLVLRVGVDTIPSISVEAYLINSKQIVPLC